MKDKKSVDLQQVLALCDEALSQNKGQRSTFLAQACDSQPELRRAVESVLIAVEGSEDFLEFDDSGEVQSMIGRTIGGYTVREHLGDGGMGQVFLAERSDGEFEQRVAIKMVRQRMMGPELRSRFDSERQLLATLHHPYIAQLFDGGTTDDGIPYFVMEYIDGMPIDQYCDEHRLGISQRIELLQKVATAVQAAHQNLIVHRDLKPSNVLITPDGIPKLLDFGIAKLVNPTDGSQSGNTTVFGHQALTPNYASPEQILKGTVTTVSDVFSLGVLSYQLLTGVLPFEVESNSHLELMKSVEDLKVPRASSRYTNAIATQQQAELRSSTSERLARRLSGDLDRILVKAMHQDPGRRYESVSAMAKDFNRFLRGMPVEAQEDTLGYRVTKFIARNKLVVTAAATTLVAIFTGLGVALWQSGVAREQSLLAQSQLVRAEAVSEFLGDILMSPSANWDSALQTGHTATISDVLVAAENQLGTSLPDYPEVRVELLHKIGEALARMGSTDDALRVQDKAISVIEAELSESIETRIEAYYHLARIQLEVGTLESTAKAVENLEKARERADAETDELTIRKLYILNDLAVAHSELHQHEQGLALQQLVVDQSFELLGPDLKALHVIGYANLASAYFMIGRFEEAHHSMNRGLEAHRLFPKQTESMAAQIYGQQGRRAQLDLDYPTSVERYRQSVALYREAFGPISEDVAESSLRLANALIHIGEMEEAQEFITQTAIDYAEYMTSPVSWIHYMVRGHLALVNGKPQQAASDLERALSLGYDYEMSRFDRLDTKRMLVLAYAESDDYERSRQLHQELLTAMSEWIPADMAYSQALRAMQQNLTTP